MDRRAVVTATCLAAGLAGVLWFAGKSAVESLEEHPQRLGDGPALPSLAMSQFVRTSAPEAISAPFDRLGGVTSEGTYSGYVEVFVQGTGQSEVGAFYCEDAFYRFDCASGEPLSLFDNTLRMGTASSLPGRVYSHAWQADSALHIEGGALHVAEFLAACASGCVSVSDNRLIDASDCLVPEYNPRHQYHFVIDLGTYAGSLTFGCGDGGVADNSDDTYDITLWQLDGPR